MTKAKKVVKAAATKKTEPKTVPITVVKDSTEIDDLFSVLASAKKAKTEPTPAVTADHTTTKEKQKKNRSKDSAEVTLSELEDLEDDEDDEEIDSSTPDEDLVKGTAYDPKKDDNFPATAPTISIADSDFFDSRGLKRKTRALTEDGFPIFTPNELKIGMGGGTDLCPFDCNCCY